MKNKAQIDMFGLVIIVILLVVIGMFSLFFIFRGSNEEVNTYNSLRVHNFANALAKSSIGGSNMEALVTTCCSLGSEDCKVLLDFAEKEFKKIEEPGIKVKFELECMYGYSNFRGTCVEGTASESIIFQTGDTIRVLLCLVS